jgi:hypothetical protein
MKIDIGHIKPPQCDNGCVWDETEGRWITALTCPDHSVIREHLRLIEIAYEVTHPFTTALEAHRQTSKI